MKQDQSYCYQWFYLAQHINQLQFKNFIRLASDLVTITTSFIFIQIAFTIHYLFFENYFAEIAHSTNTQKDCSRIYVLYFIIPLPALSFSAGLKLIKKSKHLPLNVFSFHSINYYKYYICYYSFCYFSE